MIYHLKFASSSSSGRDEDMTICHRIIVKSLRGDTLLRFIKKSLKIPKGQLLQPETVY